MSRAPTFALRVTLEGSEHWIPPNWARSTSGKITVGCAGGEKSDARDSEVRFKTFLFNVTLPVGEGQTDWAPTESADLSGRRVLIVDNSTTDRVILTEMCTAMKMMVTSCGTGSEAVELTRTSLMENRPFAMALVDRMMPAMDGFETAIYMHGLQPDLGIVMISSELHSADIGRIRDLGFCGHLLKPIRRTELLQLLSKCPSHAAAETSGGTSASIAASSPSNPTRVRTLAAEDSEDNRFLLEAYCGGSIYDLTFAFNGQRALEMLTSETFDIVIMDVQMPVMDGLTATTKIRDLEASRGSKRIPIIAMTANALQEDVTKALDAGCDAHISKPVSKKLFLNALDQWHSVSKMSGSAQVT